MASKLVLTIFLVHQVLLLSVHANNAIDLNIFEEVIDNEECQRQVRFIRRNTLLRLQFADSSIRVPRGILTGNLVDLGNYYQCLGINQQSEDMEIQGKYCSINVPLRQEFEIPNPWQREGEVDTTLITLDEETVTLLQGLRANQSLISALNENFSGYSAKTLPPDSPLSGVELQLAICIPKPCSTRQALTSLLFNLTAIGFEFTDNFCRLPDDKPWVTADTVAVVVFSIIGVLTAVSTLYDLYARFILKKGLKEINPINQSFSLYTNGQRLMSFGSGAGTLRCLEGIKTIAMAWIIVGHAFSTENYTANPLDTASWLFSASALWITAAPLTVDAFFAISGLLVVYTTAGKMNGVALLKNLHWFYLNRLIRVFPLVAISVLLQASYFNRMTDGPSWGTVESETNKCRTNWWSTLLFVQNYVNRLERCVPHSWYVAIDFQIFIICPLVLFWVLSGKKRVAWMGLAAGVVISLTGAAIYCFMNDFQAGIIAANRPDGDYARYMLYYYFNTLTRSPPFFVGMVFGYWLHLSRGKTIKLHWLIVASSWIVSVTAAGLILFHKYQITRSDWDNQIIDNIMNTFMRSAWTGAVCWLIFACVHGYSGPVNAFLSFDFWQPLGRLTYGMYLFHYPIMFSINGAEVAPVYFSVGRFTFKYLSFLFLAVVISFIMTLLVDAPISALFKKLMDTVQKKGKKAKPTESTHQGEGKLNDVKVVESGSAANEDREGQKAD